MRKYQKRESKTETDSNTTPTQPHRRFTPSSTAMSSNYFAFTQSPSTQMETCSNAAPECHEALWIKPWISVWRQSFKQTCSFFCQKGSCPWPCTILQLCWKATSSGRLLWSPRLDMAPAGIRFHWLTSALPTWLFLSSTMAELMSDFHSSFYLYPSK